MTPPGHCIGPLRAAVGLAEFAPARHARLLGKKGGHRRRPAAPWRRWRRASTARRRMRSGRCCRGCCSSCTLWSSSRRPRRSTCSSRTHAAARPSRAPPTPRSASSPSAPTTRWPSAAGLPGRRATAGVRASSRVWRSSASLCASERAFLRGGGRARGRTRRRAGAVDGYFTGDAETGEGEAAALLQVAMDAIVASSDDEEAGW